MQRTVSIKLSDKREPLLEELAAVFMAMLNDIAEIGWDAGVSAANPLHHLAYYPMREKHPRLKANHIAAGIRVVSRALRAGKTVAKRKRRKQTKPRFARPTVTFDVRTSKVTRTHCRLSTLGERLSFEYDLSAYHAKFFDGSWAIGGCTLVRRKKGWFLNVFFSKDAPTKKAANRALGIDQGIRHIAVTSKNQFFPAGKLNLRTAQIMQRRGELKSKGTPSARKRLKGLARRENRFRTDVLHCTANAILAGCDDIDVIVLEDLTKIEGNRGRNMNRTVSNWGFAQFRDILTYKAEEIGIRVQTVDARYTSQKCSGCGRIRKASRKQSQHLYRCPCGLCLNDDLNAARTIAQNYALATCEGRGPSVNRPNVPALGSGTSSPA